MNYWLVILSCFIGTVLDNMFSRFVVKYYEYKHMYDGVSCQ